MTIRIHAPLPEVDSIETLAGNVRCPSSNTTPVAMFPTVLYQVWRQPELDTLFHAENEDE